MVERDKLTVFYGKDARTVMLAEGDITSLSAEESVDYLVVSALSGDYTPVCASVIGALKDKGVDVAALAMDKEKSWMPDYPCWISKPISGQNFKRLLVYEYRQDRRTILDTLTYIFSAITDFEKQSPSQIKIAIPMLCTGSGGMERQDILEELFYQSVHWGAMRFPFSRITLVMFPAADALVKQFSDLKYKYEHLNELFSTQVYQFYARQSLGDGDEYLAAREWFAVRLYTSNFYTTINGILRSDDRDSDEYKSHRPLFEAIDTALQKLPDYQALVYRGEAVMDADRLAKHQEGKHVDNLAYTSTSKEKIGFYVGALYRFDMNSLTGSPIEKYSMYPSEREVLMKRRLSYLVDHVQHSSDYLFQVTEDAVTLER